MMPDECTHDFGSDQGTSPLNSSGDSLSGGGGNVLAQRFVFFEGLRAFPLPGSGCRAAAAHCLFRKKTTYGSDWRHWILIGNGFSCLGPIYPVQRSLCSCYMKHLWCCGLPQPDEIKAGPQPFESLKQNLFWRPHYYKSGHIRNHRQDWRASNYVVYQCRTLDGRLKVWL